MFLLNSSPCCLQVVGSAVRIQPSAPCLTPNSPSFPACPSPSQPRHHCDLCSCRFYSKQNLQDHKLSAHQNVILGHSTGQSALDGTTGGSITDGSTRPTSIDGSTGKSTPDSSTELSPPDGTVLSPIPSLDVSPLLPPLYPAGLPPALQAMHIGRPGGGSPQRQYQCSLCFMTFRTQYVLREHVQGKHQNRVYTCEACGAAFPWRSGLARHKTRSE